MRLRTSLLASTSFLISSLSVSAWAQTPPSPPPPSSPSETPAPTAPPPSTADQAPPNPATSSAAKPTAAPAPANATTLPTITVSAPPPPKRNPPLPPSQPAAAPAPPSSYDTGAPNVAGGPTVAPSMASEMTISGADLNSRPFTRPGEVLEAVPGLAVVMHADAGKANQYYLRGWNLDHGTDLATFWDDIPINLPTHAHGQGYTDLNWLIPETVSSLEVRKGPYWADVGDFENAGNLHIFVRDRVDQNIQSVTAGSFGYGRFLSLGSTKVGDGTLLYAGEFTTYDGPWTTSDDMKKFSGLLRYSQGTATDGLTLTGMAYSNTWNSTDQVALRALTTGQIGLYGELDPTDGGDTSRFSLSGRIAQSTDGGSWKANAYVVKYTMDLWNNYTWETNNPIYGDQFHQRDDRVYGGGGASRTFEGTFFNFKTETVFGVQSRYDDIITALNYSYQRQILTPYIYDHVGEGDAAIYAETTVHWTDWWRTILGWRGDDYAASVDSILQPANSGNVKDVFGSPKFRMVVGPFAKTEFFVGAGAGYHSNDARAATVTQVPGDPTTPEGASPFIVRSEGAEVGVRTKVVPGLDSSVSLFYLHQDSELFFDGDTGDTTAGPPSVRTGIEITNNYQPATWVRVDADLALSRARFLGYDTTQEALYQSLAGYPQAQIGNAPGNYVYNAPWMVAGAGITLGEKTGWFSSLRWRYISSRPLTEDGVFQSPPLNTINARVGYAFANGWRVQLDVLNLLNSTSDLATYAYGSLLTTDQLFALCYPAHGPSTVPAAVCANGVMDYVYHPLEPLAFRLTLAGPIDTLDLSSMTAEFKRAVPAYQAPAPNYDWTGPYVGAHVGGNWVKSNNSTLNAATGAPFVTANGNTSQWGGGIQLGFDYMLSSRLLFGVAADMSSGGTKTTTITDVSGTSASRTTVFDSETVRGRIGYAIDNVLFYATGGFAWSNDQFVRTQLTGALNNATAGTEEAVNKGLLAWTAGGGIAYAFAQNWNAFAEYRYTNFGSSTISLPFSQLTTSSTTKVSAVEFGVNYKFGSAAAAGSSPAIPTRAPAATPALVYKSPPVSHSYDWTGIYLGGDGGYGWAGSKGTLTTAERAPLAPYSYSINGPFAGIFVGANYQFRRWVVGIEGDWQRSNLTGNNQQQAELGATGTFPGGPFTVSTTIKDYESVRGRLGIAFDRFLLFGTGGFVWGDPSVSYALLGSAPFVTNVTNANGWTAGVGLDYAFTRNVFGRIEYRYTNLETASFLNVATNSADSSKDLPISDLRVGIAYKFDGH